MKKSFVLAVMLSLAGGAYAQTGVTLTNTLDVASDNAGDVHAATYSVSDNKFLVSSLGLTIRIYNGNTGAYESNLNLGTSAPSGTLGFFGLMAGSDGSIFGFENGATKLWQWANVGATPVEAAPSPVPFTRTGHVLGTGASTKVVMTGNANNGPVNIYTTTDDVTYSQTETIPTTAIASKSSLAVDQALTKAFAVGDTGGVINKAIKNAGVWEAAGAAFAPAAATNSAAAMVYDTANNVLFAFKGTTVYALHGDTGADLGTATVTSGINATPGYAGGYVTSTAGSGTLWLAGRGTPATNATLQKFTYTVAGVTSSVPDWSMY